MNKLDLIIVGAGPIGLACGIEAEKAKLNYLIIDRGALVNSIYNYPVNMTFFSTSERLEIGGVPFVSYGPKATRREALEYYRRVKESYNLKVNTFEEVKDIKKHDNHFHVSTSKDNYEVKNVVIATGYYDNINYMNVPGEDLKKVFHYFKEAHPYAGKHCAVIGGGNSAVDVALELFRTGADVTLIVREDDIKQSVKYWVRPDIENRLKEGTIKSCFNASVTRITENEIYYIEQNRKEIELKNDFVFAMTGYHPDFNFLEQLGIKIESHCPVYSRETLESNVPGLYLAGVVCGGMETEKLFIENTIQHGKLIVENILKQQS